MNVAIGIGTMLLGAWVPWNANEDQRNIDEADQGPVVEAPFADSAAPAGAHPTRGRMKQDPQRTRPREEVEQKLRDQKAQPPGTTKRDEEGKRVPDTKSTAQPSGTKRPAWVLPPMPTEPTRPGMLAMPSPPTTRKEDMDSGPPIPVDPYGNPTTPYMPEIPTSRHASVHRTADGPTSYEDAEQWRQQNEAAARPTYTPPPQGSKAFASARPFSSGISPYMGLFRNDTAGGTVDNYSTFVRPALDQRSLNQQFNMDIYGLERNQKLQNAALRQMGRGGSRVPQAVGTPQFYMNYGNYYSGGPGQGGYAP